MVSKEIWYSILCNFIVHFLLVRFSPHVDSKHWTAKVFAMPALKWLLLTCSRDFLLKSSSIVSARFAVELTRNLFVVTCFHNFAIIQICTYPHFSNKPSHELTQTNVIGKYFNSQGHGGISLLTQLSKIVGIVLKQEQNLKTGWATKRAKMYLQPNSGCQKFLAGQGTRAELFIWLIAVFAWS